MKQLWVLVHSIYEQDVGDDYPVVRHSFYGKTPAEALHYYESHLKTDSFLRGCQTKGRWNQVVCKTEITLERLR